VKGETFLTAAVAAGLVAGLGLNIPLARGDAKPSTMGADEVKDGMKGYGLTVFKGTEPERFDIEVVGVLRNFRPSQELILVKTPHPRLNVTKNVKGMSGSPIYIDGRLVGAYAYSWASFQVEPVAGVTPIAPMFAEMRRPIPPGFWPLEGGAPLPGQKAQPRHALGSKSTYQGAPGEYDLLKHAEQVHRQLGSPDPSRPLVAASSPLMLGGMGDRTAAFARKMFEPLGLEPMQAGGSALAVDPNAPLHYVNGGALGVAMVRGDVSFFGLGTVTHVEGTRLCGFGHPMMEAGTTALPAAIGRVHWVFASDQHSSKIGESARPLGALIQDRQSAVIVDETKVAPVFPMSVELKGVVGAPRTQWNMEVAEERFMTPGLLASVYGSVVEASANERREVTWKLKSKVSIQGKGTVELEDFGIAVGAMPDPGDFAGSRVVRLVGDIMNNPWEHAHIERIESVMSVEYTRELMRLRGVDVLDPAVDAGRPARVRLRLFTQFGGDESRVVEIKIPEELAGKDVDVEIVPGWEISPEVASPENLGDLIANSTRGPSMPRGLVAQIRSQQGVVFRGHVANRLPTFAVDALRPQNGGAAPDAFPNYARTFIPTDKFIDGRDRVRIKVRPIVR
jgi:hypothetical protein